MLIITDKKIPEQAKINLSKYGEHILLETSKITDESISGHPDVFFCKTLKKLIIAPNTPFFYKNILIKNNILFIEGFENINAGYPFAAPYNAVVTENYLIHKTNITDNSILQECKDLIKINVKQGFTRCSILPFKNNSFITSDEGICKTLNEYKFDYLYVNPSDIVLHGHKNGFFGGCCGVYENKIFIIGSLKYFLEGEKVKDFINKNGGEIIELYDGPLFDGGSILFIDF